LADAIPKSLWQCVDQITLRCSATRSINCLKRSPTTRDAVANGIRHVERLGTGLDHRSTRANQKIHLRTHRILGGKLDIIGIFQRPFTACTARSTT